MKAARRVLVVDDQQPVCESVGKILRRGGCEVAEAFDGQAAIDVLAREQFDLVIADLMMPRVSGMELLQYIKENHPTVEVIMITGYASIDSAVEATKNGAAGYVPKPFTPEELTTVVEKALTERAVPVEKPAPEEAPAEEAAHEMIDVDEPFDRRELAAATTEAYADAVGRSDIPVPSHAGVPDFCPKGQIKCKKYPKTGVCKGECPILVRAKRAAAEEQVGVAAMQTGMIDVDMPFSFAEVAAATSPAYAAMAGPSGFPIRQPDWHVAAAGRSILVIDDEPVVCNSLRRILSRRGHRVEQALEPEEGLRKIEAEPFDLVLLDLRMPGMSGLEVLTTIKERWPKTKVMIVTGYASIESAIEATRLGASQYVAKPFTPEEILRATEEVLEEVAA